LLTVGAGDRAWPMVREYILWLRQEGRYREALALLEGCEAAGTTGDRLSAALMFIVQMRQNLGDLSQTQVDRLDRALTLAESDEQRSSLLHDLGSLLQAQGDLPGARAKLERALEIKAHVYGSRDHYSTAISEMNLGFIIFEQGNTARAIELLVHAYQVFRSQLGPEHPHTQSLARLFAGGTHTHDPLHEAVTPARVAASRGGADPGWFAPSVQVGRKCGATATWACSQRARYSISQKSSRRPFAERRTKKWRNTIPAMSRSRRF
jgi:hypothetical protein